mgnify:CR=1 FL=1
MTTKTIFYENVGRRYEPAYEYDPDIRDSLPKGAHLLMIYPGGQSRRFNIDPNYAAMIAAGRIAEDKISKALIKASDLRPSRAALTEGQRNAWNKLAEEFGEETHALTWPSAREACEKAVEAMIDEAQLLLENPAVKEAWDHFLFICELTKDRDGK